MLKGFFEGDGGGGTGGADPSEGFKRLLEKHGSDALRVAELLHRENYQEREQNRALKQQLEEIRAKMPADDTQVLTKDEAALWASYQALGKADELKRALEERTALAERIAVRERADLLAKAASVSGFDPDVLAQLAGALPIAVKETADGKATAYITDTEGKERALADYAQQAWAKFLPSLKVSDMQRTPGTPRRDVERRPAQTVTDAPVTRF